MAKIIDGKAIAAQIHSQSQKRIAKMKSSPKLAVVLVGNNKASERYVKHKEIAAKEIGMESTVFPFKSTITAKELRVEIEKIQKKYKPSGIIVQLPLPQKLRSKTQEILNAVNPVSDVDCLTQNNIGRLVTNDSPFVPPTVAAIMHILEKEEKVDLKEKYVVIVGAGILVGKPLTMLMLHHEATVTVCNKYTKNLKKLTKHADILITAVGQKHIIRANMIKKGAIVIDVGVSIEGTKIYGDAKFEDVKKRAKSITPTPGGIGPITVAYLLSNTIDAQENRLSQKRKK
ncbi:MAG: bifunctional 5,10-methylene-tetrahydrofolate dehydrogenase/5,10-methylene-tetrahydrofolate cyclohydrolase [Candidatus Magasanikbacteria bacterium CG11_big_fil_rev_8_21_14_0_20_39_34]|uniref:Bifunctional protein FolD n=1 Tax=Candidatus Magasanikbacteria bacterium CG11_big_fil_rev_8_21_14_0_20_39_34 TaxID=1974653 RepID=A0A2H0N5R2_9BACT|nr:MAG: bifunctional 5,10-methylene-tetrahydrofolate dehydrogenase/5,10-methylene-tetrahydrofolate cyclohydrolase [Candidatus Magasanikbacteria bacterium CG11_big_fil_rev_8_21_14_0_20_39_34]